MKFSLDFIFIDNDEIVDVVENVPQPVGAQMPKVIVAKKDFDKVLEVNSGTVKALGINLEQKVGLDNLN